MKISDLKEDTICALATPVGQSALAVIRVSGKSAFSILKSLCPRLSQSIKTHHSYLTHVYELNGDKIDQVLVTTFDEGKSYTGESSFEVSSHGNPILIRKIISQLNFLGARLAEPGEFTFRAFMNNKIDLIQAEAIHSLIESQSEQSAKMSLRQLDGRMSDEFKNIESELIWCLAHIEASIDFSTEGLDVISNDQLIVKLETILSFLKDKLNQFQSGQIIKNGLKIALIGLPNVGKSSLLNLLVESDKAIVTNIAGTTRDIIEAKTQYQGIVFNFSDTAGLRDTTDQVEQIGVSRSLAEIQKADLNVFVLDCTDPNMTDTFHYLASHIKEINKFISTEKFIIVFNKVDLVDENKKASIQKSFENYWLNQFNMKNISNHKNIFLSSKEILHRGKLLQFILSQFDDLSFLDESIVSSARQIEMVGQSFDLIQKVKSELKGGIGSEFISQSLKEALLSIQRILGHVYDDQILDRVFKEFCLGK